MTATRLDAEGAHAAGKEDGAVAMQATKTLVEKGYVNADFFIHAYAVIVAAMRDRRIEKGELEP